MDYNKNAFRVLYGMPGKKRDSLEYTGVVWRVILQWTLMKWDRDM
jgi:hypothetical protein